MILIAGTVRIDPTDRDDAIAALTEMMAETAKEDGCVSYDFSAAFADPGLFHLFEEWESEDHLQAHFASPHMAVYKEKMHGSQAARAIDLSLRGGGQDDPWDRPCHDACASTCGRVHATCRPR